MMYSALTALALLIIGVEDLGDDDFEVRERAQRRLEDCPFACHFAQAAGRATKDPEVAFRCRQAQAIVVARTLDSIISPDTIWPGVDTIRYDDKLGYYRFENPDDPIYFLLKDRCVDKLNSLHMDGPPYSNWRKASYQLYSEMVCDGWPQPLLHVLVSEHIRRDKLSQRVWPWDKRALPPFGEELGEGKP